MRHISHILWFSYARGTIPLSRYFRIFRGHLLRRSVSGRFFKERRLKDSATEAAFTLRKKFRKKWTKEYRNIYRYMYRGALYPPVQTDLNRKREQGRNKRVNTVILFMRPYFLPFTRKKLIRFQEI